MDSLVREYCKRTPKRKRGRPRKASTTSYLPSINLPAAVPRDNSHLTYAHKTLKAIMEIHRIGPFLDKPDSSYFGLHNYYRLVRNPMWIKEVCRKLSSGEYLHLGDFVSDIRLMLHNCYSYWGPSHRITKIGLQIENILEKHIKTYPQNVQELLKLIEESESASCNDESGGHFEKEVCLDGEQEDGAGLLGDEHGAMAQSEAPATPVKRGFESKILQQVIKKSRGKQEIKRPVIENMNEIEEWEKKTFPSENKSAGIPNLWQLAAIGQFMKVSWKALDLDEVTQFEVERMLLMPRESFTLACIMTSLLCPRFLRSHLFSSPIMCYQVWNQMLKNKIDLWYKIYYTYENPIKVLEKCGVEPNFWAAMGDVNPLSDVDFHELNFFRKAWIMYSLCTYNLHSVKAIEDLWNTQMSASLRPEMMGSDGRYNYVALFSPEVRIYRQLAIPPDQWNIEFLHPEVSPGSASLSEYFNKEFQNSGYLPPSYVYPNKKDFALVAWDIESLESLISSLKDKETVTNLRELDLEKHTTYTLHGLHSIYSQWEQNVISDSNFIAKSLDYWICKNRGPFIQPESPEELLQKETLLDLDNVDNPDLNVIFGLGKRKRKKRFLEDTILDTVSPGEGSDVSDWEVENKLKRVRRRRSRREVVQREVAGEMGSDASTETCSGDEDTSVQIMRCRTQARPSVVSAALETARSMALSPPPPQDVLTIAVRPQPEGILSRGFLPDGSFGYYVLIPGERVIPLTEAAAQQLCLENGRFHDNVIPYL